MAIKKTDVISLNGSGSAFGGRIYNANLQVGYNETPSTVTLSIVSKNGSYNISPGSLRTTGSPDLISFGNKSIRGYPVYYSIDKGSDGKILNIEYHDESIRYLDKKFVLLKGQHVPLGMTNNPNSPYVVVGDKYQIISETVYNPITKTETQTRRHIKEVAGKEYQNLGASYYTPKQLLEAMQAHGIPMHSSVRNILSSYDIYLDNIVGDVRSVLSAWSNKLAFAFYWNEGSSLQFIDMRAGRGVSLGPISGVDLINEEVSYSIKDTIAKGTCLYYGTNGEEIEGIGNVSKSIKFKREPLPNSATLLNLMKAAVVGEQFLIAYALSKMIEDKSDDWPLLGLNRGKSIDEETAEQILGTDYVEENFKGDYRYCLFKQEKGDISYGDLMQRAERYTIFEGNLSDSDLENYSNWSHPFTIEDIEEGYATIRLPFEEVWPIPDPEKDETPLKGVNLEAIDIIEIGNLQVLNINLNGYNRLLAIDAGLSSVINNIVQGVKVSSQTSLYSRGTKVRRSTFSIPRTEYILNALPSNLGNVYKIDVNLETADDSQLTLTSAIGLDVERDWVDRVGKVIEDSEEIDWENAKILNKGFDRVNSALQGYLSQISRSATNQSQAQTSRTFTVSNINLPSQVNIESGLESMSVSLTEDGFKTTYTLGNTRAKIVDKDVLRSMGANQQVAFTSSQAATPRPSASINDTARIS